MNLFRHTVCPWCGVKHDADTLVATKGDVALPTTRPEPGDLTMCAGCGEWAMYDIVPGGLRKPDDEEFLQIGNDPNCRAIRAAWTEFQQAREMTDGR